MSGFVKYLIQTNNTLSNVINLAATVVIILATVYEPIVKLRIPALFPQISVFLATEIDLLHILHQKIVEDNPLPWIQA